MKNRFPTVILLLIASSVLFSCDKKEAAQPPVQDLSLTDYETITDNIVIENGTLITGKIDTINVDKTVKILSVQDFEPTFSGGEIEINVSYSYKDTLDKFRFEIIGASKHWEAPVFSTTLIDTLKTGNFRFRTPENLMPGILKFRYQLFRNDSVKTNPYSSEIEILQLLNSGGTIKI